MTAPHSSGPDDFDPAQPEHWPPPPEPSAAVWEKTRTDIVARLSRKPARRRWAVAASAGGLIAAGVLAAWLVWPPAAPPTVPTEAVAVQPADPLAEYDVLPIATAADVMVSVVRGSDTRFGSINEPVPEVLPIATAADVSVLKGPLAGELSCPDPGGMAVYVMPEK